MEKKENVMRFKCMAEKGEREREGRKKNRVKHSLSRKQRVPLGVVARTKWGKEEAGVKV